MNKNVMELLKSEVKSFVETLYNYDENNLLEKETIISNNKILCIREYKNGLLSKTTTFKNDIIKDVHKWERNEKGECIRELINGEVYTEKEYTETGKLLKTTTKDRTSSYEYDEKNRCIKCTSLVNGDIISSLEHQYFKDSNSCSRTIFKDDTMEAITLFNEKGEIMNVYENGKLVFKNTYDIKDRKILSEEFENEKLISKTEYKYSSNKNYTIQNYKINKDDILQLTDITSVYDNCITQMYIENNRMCVSTLNENGKLLSEVTISEQSIAEVKFKYNEKGDHLYTKHITNNIAENIINTGESISEYDENNNLVSNIYYIDGKIYRLMLSSYLDGKVIRRLDILK